MSTIIVQQSGCELFDEPDDGFLKKLDNHLSFRIAGVEYTQAFRGYINDRGEEVTWDGRRHLMTSSGKFPTGLLPRVQKFYKKHKKDVQVIDQTPEVLTGNPCNILPKLQEMGKEPYPYQYDAVRIAKDRSNGVIKIGTGGGKTLVIAMLIGALGKSATVYVIGKDLLYQIHRLLSTVFEGEEIGIIGDGNCSVKDINVATIWSVGQVLGIEKNNSIDDESTKEKKIDPEKFKLIKGMLRTTKVHVLDECHMAACDTVQEISRNIRAEHIYGFSASPWRDDGADLLIEAVFGEKIVDYSAKYLISNGYLVKPMIRFLVPPAWGKSSKSYQTIYSKYVVENEDRNNMIIKGAEALIKQDFQPLILFHSIKHGNTLYEMAKNKIPCALLSGKDTAKQRDKVKQDLEDGKISAIFSSKIFDIGVDIPTLSGLIVAGGGKSSVRALQRIGRVIRKAPNKTSAGIFDYCDQAPYLLKHSKARHKIYSAEFDDVKWPEK